MWDGTRVSEERFSIAQVLRQQAAEHPDEVALVGGDGQKLTYGELDSRSNRLAQRLRAAGVRAGDRVAHLDRNVPAAAELLFASAKCGAAFVPLNWRLAEPELTALLHDCHAPLLFCGESFAESGRRLSDAPDSVVVLDGESADAPDEDPHDDGDLDAVVLQLYTSGTTGRPKGVQITNRNLSLLTAGVAGMWEVDASSVSLVAMPLFHIGGMGWLLVGLANGAANVLVPEIDPPALLDTMEREGVTNAFLVPTVLQMLSGVPGAAERDWSALRSIAYGASAITTTVLKTVLRTFGCPLYQVYGMTETTGAIVQLDAADHDPDGPRAHLLRSAGRPYEWMELRIVDPATEQECAPTEIGEVQIRGDSVTPGYFDNPEETERALDSEGWLHTGDGGYLDEEGYLFLTDRIKDMIVTGAENVYPIEVEEVLAGHPAVNEVAVFGVPDERWGELVCAAVVPRGGEGGEGGELDTDKLVAYARERLAGYKLPRRVHVIDELPKTGSGKVSKKDLRAQFGG
jgi:long-chain acyl-CoA synthetase